MKQNKTYKNHTKHTLILLFDGITNIFKLKFTLQRIMILIQVKNNHK